MRLALALLCVTLPGWLGAAAVDEQRYHELINELRCLVCQNQTIAESDAPIAADLRREVHAQVVAGRSNEQIIAFLTERYGDFVRYRPPVAPRTWLLWLGPFLVLGVGCAVAWSQFRRRPAPAGGTRASPPT